MRDEALKRLFLRFRDKADGKALAAVFDGTARELLRVASHLVHRPEEAEDLVQVTFLRAMEKAASFDAQFGLKGWLFGILWREAAKGRRTGARVLDAARLVERTSDDPADVAAERELPLVVRQALEKMPRRYREVLEPVILEERSSSEIAAQLGRAPGTVRVQLQRGLERLRKSLPRDMAAWGVLALPVGLDGVRAAVLRRAGIRRLGALGQLAVLGKATYASLVTAPALGVAGVVTAGTLLAVPPVLDGRSAGSTTQKAAAEEGEGMNASTLAVLPLALGLHGQVDPAQGTREEVVVTDALERKIQELDRLVTDLLDVATSDRPEAEEAWAGLMGAIGKVEAEYRRRQREEQEDKVREVDLATKWFEAVSRLGDPQGRSAGLDEIHAALTSSDPVQQTAACSALSRLSQVKFDKEPFRRPVLDVVHAASGTQKVTALYALYNTSRRPEDVEFVLDLAEDAAPEAASRAVHLLFLFNDGDLTGEPGRAVERLLGTDDEELLRGRLGGLWGARVSPAIEQRLLDLSHGDDYEMRHEVVYFGLSTLADKSPAVIERLIELVSTGGREDSGRALWGLGHGVRPEHGHLVAAAMKALVAERSDVRTLTTALGYVALHGCGEDVPWLQALADDTSAPDAVRKAAREAVAEISNQ